MSNCGHDKKNYQKCHVHGYNFEFEVGDSISATSSTPVTCMTHGISRVSNAPSEDPVHLKEEKHTAGSPLQYSSLIFTLQLILQCF